LQWAFLRFIEAFRERRVNREGRDGPWHRRCSNGLDAEDAEFAEGRTVEDTETIAGVLARLGLDAGAVLDRAQSNENRSQLRAHTEEAQRLGIFGSPSFVTADGELFWGHDRLEAALNWARR